MAAFRVALRRFFRASELAAREHGLSPRQYLLLLLVKGAPDGSEQATVGELAERIQLAQSTVTELVGRAVDAGLVTARASPGDRRVSEVRVTAKGDRRLRACLAALADERQQLQEALDGV